MEHKVVPSPFTVKSTKLMGYFHLPEGAEKPPVIVMAHGFGAEMAFGLQPFWERFVSRGMAVFAFDYRNLGESEGLPRNLVHPFRHREDWLAAIRHVRKSNLVDASRVGLWGTSFSGGHVVGAAARDGRVQALVSQVPFMDGLDVAKTLGPAFAARATLASLKDWAGSLAGNPFFVPIVAAPGTLSPLSQPGNLEDYIVLLPEEARKTWDNRCPARVFLLTTLYRPILDAPKVPCPALVIAAGRDNLVSPDAAEKAAKQMPDATFVRLDMGHFDPYTGAFFETVSKLETEFFEKYLKP